MPKLEFLLKFPFSQKLNIATLYSENLTFYKTHEIEHTPSTMFKRQYIDEIEYPPSPICGKKPKFEFNVTSFQFCQNALDQGLPSATPSPWRYGGDHN